MIRLRTTSVDETRELAAALAPIVRKGDLLLLSGELGAGKTAFVQGLGRALGVTEPITSPTFTLVRTYAASVPLVHADLYRLDHLQEVIDLGLAELLDDSAVALIEWGDVAASIFTPDYLSVRLELDPDDTESRSIAMRTVGSAWAGRSERISDALQRWRAE